MNVSAMDLPFEMVDPKVEWEFSGSPILDYPQYKPAAAQDVDLPWRLLAYHREPGPSFHRHLNLSLAGHHDLGLRLDDTNLSLSISIDTARPQRSDEQSYISMIVKDKSVMSYGDRKPESISAGRIVFLQSLGENLIASGELMKPNIKRKKGTSRWILGTYRPPETLLESYRVEDHEYEMPGHLGGSQGQRSTKTDRSRLEELVEEIKGLKPRERQEVFEALGITQGAPDYRSLERPPDLTGKQFQLLKYIMQSLDERGFPPSIPEICEELSANADSTARWHLSVLERKGYISREKGKYRTITVNFQKLKA